MKYQHFGYFHYVLLSLLIVHDGILMKVWSKGYTTWHHVDAYLRYKNGTQI